MSQDDKMARWHSLDMSFGSVTAAASSGWGGTQLHTTTTRTYDPTTLTCLVCTGKFEGNGITILIGDQNLPAVVTVTTDNCVVVIRYSNTNLTELYE